MYSSIRFTCVAVLLFSGSVLGADQSDPVPLGVSGATLTRVEKEVERLNKQAKLETGPEHPRPSEQLAFMLLAGVAAQGERIVEPSREEKFHFNLDQRPFKTQLFLIARDARLVKSENWMQDKAGTIRVTRW